MAKQEEIIVYWAPSYDVPVYANTDPYQATSFVYPDWNMLYKDPTNSFDELRAKRSKAVKQDSYIYCPAVADVHKNTFVFYNSVEGEWTWDNEKQAMVAKNPECIGGMVRRPPSIENALIFSYNMFYSFYCEEDLQMEVTAPFFHKTTYSQYGTFMAGTFNIGAWYREINADFQMWEGETKFQIAKDDPLFYARFYTDKKVVLKRFKVNKEIESISGSCRDFRLTFGKFTSWEEKYKQFKMSRTNKILAQLIKENVVNE